MPWPITPTDNKTLRHLPGLWLENAASHRALQEVTIRVPICVLVEPQVLWANGLWFLFRLTSYNSNALRLWYQRVSWGLCVSSMPCTTARAWRTPPHAKCKLSMLPSISDRHMCNELNGLSLLGFSIFFFFLLKTGLRLLDLSTYIV